MKTNTGHNRRYLIIKNLILMLVMLVLIMLAIWAWFFSSGTVSADGICIKAHKQSNVQIALPKNGGCPDNSDFTDSISFVTPTATQLLYRDITSDGVNFIIPTFEADKDDYANGRRVVPEGTWTVGKSTKDVADTESTEDDQEYHYFAQDFYLRSESAEISVSSNSYLAAKSDLNNKPLHSNNRGDLERNDITYGGGHFSSDAIVGAIRVSLVGQPVTACNISHEGQTNELRSDTLFGSADTVPRLLWLPRPDLCLNTANNYDDFSLLTNIKPGLGSFSNYINKTYRHIFYKKANANNNKGVTQVKYYDSDIASISGVSDSYKKFVDGDTNYLPEKSFFHVSHGFTQGGRYPTLGKDCRITENNSQSTMSFTNNGETTNFYVYKMTLNLWIEGEDAEARRAMGNGEFSMFMEFM